MTVSAVLLTSATLTGCAGRVERLIGIATSAKGKAQARVHLPEAPAYCKRDEPHAPLVVGAEALTTLDRERQATNNANDRRRYCIDTWYGDLKRELE